LACLVDDPHDLQHISELRQYVKTIDYVVINPLWQKIASLPCLLTDKPLSVPYFYSATLQEAINKRLDETEIDVVFCFSSPMAEYIFKSRHYLTGKLQNTRLIMDFVDVDSDKWRMYAGFSRYPMSMVYNREWLRLQAYDTKVGRKFDWSIFVSDKEVELFKSFCPEARIAAIANGVDTDYFSTVHEMRTLQNKIHRQPTLMFMGAMDYYPNEDAVVYFADEVMPLLLKKVPTVQFVIVGSNPSKRVSALGARPGIKITGAVPDVRPYLAETDVFVAPLRIARGVQNKVLEAMSAGVPVVARPEAVQGFVNMNAPLMVENSPESFAASIIELLEDENKRATLALEALRFVRTSYCWNTNMAVLDNLF
jgi:sugar transferase (PEP-CTERM/EpsH1 system associated)